MPSCRLELELELELEASCRLGLELELELELSCRLGGGTLGHTQWGQQVWRFPLTMRGAVAAALEAAAGVRCSVEDVHPVPRAYLEVCHAHPCYRIPSEDFEALLVCSSA